MIRTFAGLLILGCVGVMLFCAGCAGVTTLTGGSIPIGEVDGRVYLRAGSDVPAAFITVELRNAGGQVLQTTQTDALGQFAFDDVSAGTVVVTSTVGTQTAEVGFNRGNDTKVRVALLLITPDPTISAVKIVGPAHAPDQPIEVSEGVETDFSAEGTNLLGHTVPDLPVSWALVGGLGDILPNGKMAPETVGVGDLVAQYGTKAHTEHIRVNAKQAK